MGDLILNPRKKVKKDKNQPVQNEIDKQSNLEKEKKVQTSETESGDVNLETETDLKNQPMTAPKKVERKIKHPKTDVVRYEDPDLDSNWGWAIEFPNTESLEPVWTKLKDFLNTSAHPVKGKVSWLSLDPRGYFSPRLRHFIAFTGWGIQIEDIDTWFKEKISTITKPAKAIEASEELAEGNWQGYIVKEKIDLTGSEFIKLDNFSRNKRKVVEEAKKPISSNIPRYWSQQALFTARDYLIPVITEDKYNAGETDSVSYLEEYIVEQLEWKEPDKNKDSFVILPSEFTYNENATRKIDIPEEYTPEINYDYPGMFPGMGGLGGMGGMPDFGDMPDLDDSELGDMDLEGTESSDSEEADESIEKKDAIDAEIVPDDK